MPRQAGSTRSTTQRAGDPGVARRAPLSRQQIVDAAFETVRSGRYEEMTIRSLAASLGVAPMALYRHVRDRDDLLVEVTDRLLAQTWRPRARPSNWQAWITEAADRLRNLLVDQPAALHTYLRQPVTTTTAITRMDTSLDVLTKAGFNPQDARRAYAAVHTYTVGFAALEASRTRWTPDPDVLDPAAERLAAFTTPRQFADGIHLLLTGIQRENPTQPA